MVYEGHGPFLDVDKLKISSLAGRSVPTTGRGLHVVREWSLHDLTVLKVYFGELTLNMYEIGDRVLRINAITYNEKDAVWKDIGETLAMLAKPRRMLSDFQNAI
jgi:hypothetical protein